MKNILVPIDFSLCSTNAVNQAISIAQKTKAEIFFFHSINSSVDWVNLKSSVPTKKNNSYTTQLEQFPEIKKQINIAHKKLEELKQIAKKKNISASVEIGFNKVHSDIISYATKKKIDLIVMGTTGAGGIKGVLIGSNTAKIIRLSDIPILTVGVNNKTETITNITYVSDFEEESLNKNIIEVKNFALNTKVKLNLLYINTPTFFESTRYSTKKIDTIILKYKLDKNCYTIYNDFTVEEGVCNHLHNNLDSIIAISTHKRKGFSRILYDNITELLLGKIQTPLLILPKK
jgi:nucleotide-binding universal stress UspA family protein